MKHTRGVHQRILSFSSFHAPFFNKRKLEASVPRNGNSGLTAWIIIVNVEITVVDVVTGVSFF